MNEDPEWLAYIATTPVLSGDRYMELRNGYSSDGYAQRVRASFAERQLDHIIYQLETP